MKALAILFFLYLAFTATAYTQPTLQAQNLLAKNKSNNWSFEENRGQLADENGVGLKDIKYYGRDKGVSVYLRKNKISFVFTKTEAKNNSQPAFSEATGAVPFAFPSPYKGGVRGGFSKPGEIKISTSRIDLEIVSANPATQILAEEKISYYTNYYLAHTPEKGITNVPHFKKITYKNIYRNIDLVLYVKEHGMKYEFVVHPKGKVSDIKLAWNGTKPDVLADGGIKYASVLGEIKESAPFSFIAGENGKEVKSAFKVKENYVGFDVGKYDESKKLVIDPILVWGTYYGGDNYEAAWDISTDKSGFLYVTGQASSNTGIGTSGTHQPYLNGNMSNAFVVKFSSDGVRQWGTYYGGNNGAYGWGVATDVNNNVYLSGSTRSTTGIATSGAHQGNYGGNDATGAGDAFLAKFNSNGNRIWSTYYGDKESEGGFGICTDKSGNVYMAGVTSSYSSIATPGAHQEIYSGENDGFLVKFNSDGVRQWGTYYGGSDREFGGKVIVDDKGNIYLYSRTYSRYNIASPGAHQENLSPNLNPFYFNSDCYLVKFNSDGERQWGTYYGGSGDEYFGSIATDNAGNIFLAGFTNSTSGIATSGAYQASLRGNSDAFVVKFSKNGFRQWGTYFGGESSDYAAGIVTDNNGNIYITGNTNSTSGIATPGAHKTINPGYCIFIAKLNDNGIRQWGTYYGGGNNDDVTNIAINDSGNIFIAGRTNSTTGIATPDAHKPYYSGNSDIFIARFLTSPPPYNLGVVSIDSPGINVCEGKYRIYVKVKNYTYLAPVDSYHIGWSLNGNLQKEFKWQGILKSGDTTLSINIGSYTFDSGTFLIKAWTYLPNGITDSINNNDTFSFVINVHPFPPANTGGNKKLCLGEKTTIGASSTAGNTYSWTSIPSGFTSTSSNPTVSPLATTIYYLTETKSITSCAKTDSVIITVVPKPIIQISGDSFICNSSGSVYKAIKTPGTLYSWSLVSGNIIAGQGTDSIFVIWNSTSQNGKISLNIIDSNGCSASIKKEVYIYQSPSLEIGIDKYICEEDGNLVKIDAGKEFTTYRWYPTGDTTQYLIVRKAGDYYVVVQDKCGNPLQDDIRIAARCPVLIFIPSAFTPDGNGLNETFQPVGNYISEEGYSFSIYNRWGERIFTSTSYNTGWDGKFESNSVPEGIYLWMLECTVKEGALIRKLHKTGTVQLLK